MTQETIFSFSSSTGEYLGSEIAHPNPRKLGQYLLPAQATFIKPPTFQADEIAVWDGKDWSIKQDWRGREYWLPDGTRHVIAAIGEGKPKGALDEPPPPSSDELRENAVAQIDGFAEEVRQGFVGTASSLEIAAWPRKADIARRVLDDTATEAERAAIEKEAELRGKGESVEMLAALQIAKADAMAFVIAAIDGLASAARTAIENADPEAIDDLLVAFKTRAETQLSKLKEQ